MNNRRLIEKMDDLACSNLNPDMMDKWSELVRYWDEVIPSCKGVKKDYHEEDSDVIPCEKCGQTDTGQYGEHPCSECSLPMTHG